MATKAPIYLKRGGRRGKKEKLRDVLSSDMISPPLGDFRHTIHVGSGGQGDTFGDVSFLQGKFHLLPRGAGGEGSEEDEAPFAFPRAATLSGGEPAAAPSPLLKNAISLPALGAGRALTLPAAPPKPPRLRPDEDTAASSPERPRRADGDTSASASRAGSLLSLHVDLGPSILEDVLQVMERHRADGGAARPRILT